MRKLALGLITVYQYTLSRLLPPACRFWPTCSRYAYEAIERYGVRQGGWLTLGRSPVATRSTRAATIRLMRRALPREGR